VYTDGEISETYNVGGNNEKTNIEVVRTICSILDTLLPTNNFKYESLIRHVEDRKGHDYRYAIDSSKIQNSLGWFPLETFDTGIKKTIEHYVKDFLKV
jgi:dTDP-glucose 4,6-dehydratase